MTGWPPGASAAAARCCQAGRAAGAGCPVGMAAVQVWAQARISHVLLLGRDAVVLLTYKVQEVHAAEQYAQFVRHLSRP